MRLGIFGGSFDPVHYGHLLLAESCREQMRLDRVLFVPAGTPPHKQGQAQTPAAQRLEMLALAIGGHPAFEVSSLEIDRGGVTYTVDTLEGLRAERPEDELFLLLGADMFADLPNWREPRRVVELALPVVVRRPGAPAADDDVLRLLTSPERCAAARAAQVQMPLVGFSSSEIRLRVSEGRSIRYWTPRAVEKYIEVYGLYMVH
ncbi:MAG: nicotinate-nucleotide adenylyltransferase [Pirellulales bacterium]